MSETLEEVAEQFEYTNGIYGFKQGVKWQQERSYSETNIKEAFLQGLYHTKGEDTVDEWFETFKKK